MTHHESPNFGHGSLNLGRVTRGPGFGILVTEGGQTCSGNFWSDCFLDPCVNRLRYDEQLCSDYDTKTANAHLGMRDTLAIPLPSDAIGQACQLDMPRHARFSLPLSFHCGLHLPDQRINVIHAQYRTLHAIR